MTEAARKLLLIFFAGTAMLFSGRASAIADQWKYVTATEQGARCFYDAPSVVPMSKDVIEVRTKEIAGDGSTKRALEEIDCTNKIVREHEVVMEMPNMPPQTSHELTNWRAMESDPFMSQLFKALCR